MSTNIFQRDNQFTYIVRHTHIYLSISIYVYTEREREKGERGERKENAMFQVEMNYYWDFLVFSNNNLL